MARMRILSEAYREIKIEDPETALTMNALRVLIKSGEIPTIKSGRKTLINYDALTEYLNKR